MYQAYRCHSERRSSPVSKSKKSSKAAVEDADNLNLAAHASKSHDEDDTHMEKLVMYAPNQEDEEEEMLLFCKDDSEESVEKDTFQMNKSGNDISTTEESTEWSFSNEAEVEFLNSVVEEMRSEIQSLRRQLEHREQECVQLHETLEREKEGDRQRMQFLVQALGTVSSSAPTLTQDAMEALSADEASNLTITTLTRKIEQLSVENSALKEHTVDLVERIQQLEGSNEAMKSKIEALELQFRTINNKMRRNTLSKLF
eukprot:scaffold17330_cov161-Amphora_coffeaeformis.AAC.1